MIWTIRQKKKGFRARPRAVSDRVINSCTLAASRDLPWTLIKCSSNLGRRVSEIQHIDNLRRVELGQARDVARSRSTVKLLTGLAMVGLAVYLVGIPDALAPLSPAQTNSHEFKFAPAVFSVDRDCNYFRTQAEAQAFFQQAGAGDPHHLDDDGDGIACDLNPWMDWRSWFGSGR